MEKVRRISLLSTSRVVAASLYLLSREYLVDSSHDKTRKLERYLTRIPLPTDPYPIP
jgi:hypothetical protein